MTKEQAKIEIEKLVNRFDSHIEEYKNSEYNETQTRRDFIDPFFKSLGWDIDNEQDYAEAYREVIHEAKQRVKEGKTERTKAPDYAFRIGGKKIFFLEAKKPNVSLKDAVHPAYQVRRYGWSAKLPISIITDFEELSVYDCTKKPIPSDKAAVARLKYITYKDYLKEFDFIWNNFSKESVLKGSFDKFVKSDTNKKGTATVDSEFLQSLDKWRTYLATSISLNNKDLDEDEINFVIQQTIDRIIFMRIAEDRNVEFYGQLKNCLTKGNYYQNLFDIFKKADEKYNSGLFDFKKDNISKNVEIDNKVIKNIITELYYPDCPYEFSVLSVEILGSAYEQFLGKVIRITPSHHAKIEEKPEVRKAGGVYYTPQYVVEYIVKNTVGKLIEGKTPKEIEEIKIVDPACGSGSFLIGAYQFLLDYHKDFYSNKGKPSKGKKESTLTLEGNLTSAEKKKILINNIFGVDIDINAVEVTKLSLLLKCMEGETETSINQQLKLWNERVLPTLDNNIKCGNSLIGQDYYRTIDINSQYDKTIRPFNWEKEFPEVFKPRTSLKENELLIHAKNIFNKADKAKEEAIRLIDKYKNKVEEPQEKYRSRGGFDVVIGNPPYVSVKEIDIKHKEYYTKKYQVATGQFDLYTLFIEKSFEILNDNGLFGMITSNTYLSNKDTKILREIILKTKSIIEIVNLGETVFKDANLDVSILIIKMNYSNRTNCKITTNDLNFRNSVFHFISQKDWLKNNDNFELQINISLSDSKILLKIFENKSPLSNYLDLPRGIEIGGNSDLILTNFKNNLEPILFGRSINQYQIIFDNKYIKFENNKSVFKDIAIYKQEKLLIQRIRNLTLQKRIVATYDSIGYLCTNTLRIGILKNNELSLKYLLGLLNSSLINWIFLKKFLNKDIYAYQLEQIPIKQIDFKNKYEKSQYVKIIEHVDLLLQLNEDILKVTIDNKRQQIQGKIDYCESRINEIVYKLYDLTADEIKIIGEK